MSDIIGDIKVRILVETLQAQKNSKEFVATLHGVEQAATKVKHSTVDLSDKAVKLGFVMNTVREVNSALTSSLRAFFSVLQSSNEAYQGYLSSQRQLSATSKLTGANLDELKRVSDSVKQEFALSSNQSNLFTIELTKLGQKAGDVSRVQESIRALMDLGAGQGLNAEQSLYAIKQALLGIDEGTDKLFQKNPSVLYEEFTNKIGTTAGKLTDQQKAQALLNAVLESGGKLTGQYSDYLHSAAGKQQEMNNKINDAKIKLGEQLQPALAGVLDYVIRLLNAYNSLGTTGKTVVVTFGLLGISLGRLIPLLGSLITTFPRLGAVANTAASNIARLFGSGGPIVIAIGIAIWWVSELADKIADASEEAKQLEQYQKRLKEGTFIFDSSSYDDKTIAAYEKLAENDPEGKISYNGVETKYSDIANDLKKKRDEARKVGQSWEELTGQTETSIKLQRLAYDKMQESFNDLDKQLKRTSPDDVETFNNLKRDRDKVGAELKKLEDMINPPESKGGSKGKSKKSEQLYEVDRILKEITDKEKDLSEAQSRGHKGLIKDLEEEITLLNERKEYLISGVRSFSEIAKELNLKSAVDEIKDKLKSNLEEILKAQEDADADISLKKIMLIEDEFKKRKAEIDHEYDMEIKRINELTKITNEQRKSLVELAKLKKDSDTKNIERDLALSSAKKVKEEYDAIINNLSSAYNLVSAISSKLSGGGKDFWFWVMAALQVALQVTKLLSKNDSKEGIGFGDILGAIGTILPFFLASGGPVPGSGSGDTVPAMLTPGEYVLNKYAAARLGPRLLQLLNGGGTVNNIPGLYRGGDSAPIIINVSGELTDNLSYHIVNRGSKIRKVKINKSSY